MSAERIGLYWSTVIKESPKYKYDKHYGILVMLPFILSWIGFLSIPFLMCIKNKKTLRAYNNIFFYLGYSFLTPFLIIIFIVANLALMPLAYIKTAIHKAELLRAYSGKGQFFNLIFYILFGIPLLCVS